MRGCGKLDFSRVTMDAANVASLGGAYTPAPKPADKGKLGSKRYIITNREGILLIFSVTGPTGMTRS